MKNLFFLSALLVSQFSFTQPVADTTDYHYYLEDINQRQTNFSRMSMTSLNCWAVSNIAVGASMYSSSDGQERYFHQMNMIWNVVNLGIGIPGLIKTYKQHPTDFKSILKSQNRYEKVYLFNSGLDLGYMATGWALNNFGKTQAGVFGERMKGYGNSLVMQGGFLLVHDLVMYFFYRSNNRRLEFAWKKIRIEPLIGGIRINIE